MMNSGIKAKKMATVKLIVGHERKNKMPERSDKITGCTFFTKMICVKITERTGTSFFFR